MNNLNTMNDARQSSMTTTQSARIAVRSSCSGTVHIASLKVGRKVVYETRAWGTAYNAAQDAKSKAENLGLAVK
jgi:hypothetical protein